MILRFFLFAFAVIIYIGGCDKLQVSSNQKEEPSKQVSIGRDTIYLAPIIGKEQGMGVEDVERIVDEALRERSFTIPRVPSSFEFAGEKVMFDTCEKYERMEREILAFCYMHSQSILMLKRSGRYFPQVEPILKARGVPEDFKYLMVIESSLDPKAYSSAGAAGLWQFTKASAKELGLEVNDFVDQRYDVVSATEAACHYLADSYSTFVDWLTVAASYNAGNAAIRRFTSQQHRTCATDLWMAEETTRYIYRLMACKMMFEDPSAFGFDVPEEDRYIYIKPKKTVSVTAPISDLVEFALSNGVSYADFKRANLWLRDRKLPNKSHREYRIVIPGDQHISR